MIDRKEFVMCNCCNKLRKRFNNYEMCQDCYRKLLKEYSFYDYKVPKENLSGNTLRICEMLIEEGVERKEIHKILNLNKVYVNIVINKNTKRVNVDGKERPF